MNKAAGSAHSSNRCTSAFPDTTPCFGVQKLLYTYLPFQKLIYFTIFTVSSRTFLRNNHSHCSFNCYFQHVCLLYFFFLYSAQSSFCINLLCNKVLQLVDSNLFSPFWRLEVWDQGIGGVGPSAGSRRECALCFLPRLCGFLAIWGLSVHHPSLCFHPNLEFSFCADYPYFLYNKNINHMEQPLPISPHLN